MEDVVVIEAGTRIGDWVFAALAFAFAAFCVWLGVRIFNRRERWAKLLAIATAILAVAGAAFVGLGLVLDYYFGGV